MSNPRIQRSASAPPQVTKVESSPSIKKINQPSQIPQAPPLPQKSKLAKKPTEDLAVLNIDINKNIDDISPEVMQKKQRALPTTLLEIENKLASHRKKLIGKSFTNDMLKMKSTKLETHNVNVESDFDSSSLSRNYSEQLTNVNIGEQVKNSYGNFATSLSDTYMTKSKNKVFDAAKAQAKKSVMTSTVDTDFMYQLSTLSESQLKDKIASGIGANRSEKYGDNASYSQLSTKKQSLVDAIYAGYQEGIEASSGVLATDISKKMQTQLEGQLQNAAPDSKLVFDLTLKSTDNIKSELAHGMGMLSENGDMATLTPAQNKILDHSVQRLNKVIQQHLPNRASDIAPLANRRDKSAPSSITLNGTRYASPQYLGQGGLGMVLKYTNENDPNDTVVVKSLLQSEMREEMVKEALAHRHAMGSDGHDNIVGLRGMATGPNESLYMVMDLADGGDLKGMASSMDSTINDAPILTPRAKDLLTQHFFSQMVEGMEYVQSRNMLHLDIKDENFLLDSEGTVKVADFGSSQRKTTLDSGTEKVATTYKPMEWETKSTLTQKTDTYQLGRMLYVMMGGKGAEGLVNPSNERATQLQKEGLQNNSFVKNGAAQRLMTKMLDHNPENRPTLEAVKNHSFVKDYDANNTSVKALVSGMMDYHKQIQPINKMSSRINQLTNQKKAGSTSQEQKVQIQQDIDRLTIRLTELKDNPALTQATQQLQTAVSNLRTF